MRPLVLALLLPLQLANGDLGERIVTQPPLSPIRLTRPMIASWYHLPGWQRADGHPYGGMTVAHRTLPLGSHVTLCRADRPLICASVTIADRGPWVKGREWDLSRAAARQLCMLRAGVISVVVQAANQTN